MKRRRKKGRSQDTGLIVPRRVWDDAHPDPTLGELYDRFHTITLAIDSARVLGLSPRPEWILEVTGGFGRKVRVSR